MDPSPLATVALSLEQDVIARLRQTADVRQVSMSQVVREALALAVAFWSEDEDVLPAMAESAGASTLEQDRDEACERANVLRWPRDVRRHAARHGEPFVSPDSP
jgi:hypothetical protein